MTILPRIIVQLLPNGLPAPKDSWFERVDPTSPEGRALSEADWDDIICANVSSLSDALREAGVIKADSTLRVLGKQIENVDVMLVELKGDDAGPVDAGDWGEPRRLILLEDKLVRNPEQKRQVLAQVLDYSQRAQYEWSVESTLLASKALAQHRSWIEVHRSRLKVLLAQGDFLLVICGDEIDEDLLRLARRFAAGGDPLSSSEMCLVSMTRYRRDNEVLLIPHVVSAVERQQRQISIRVHVEDSEGRPVAARVERDVEEDATARRGSMPKNAAAAAFLARARRRLDSELVPRYEVSGGERRLLAYQRGEAQFKIHFGEGESAHTWTPIAVGIFVESPTDQALWYDRVLLAHTAGRIPEEAAPRVKGKQRVTAFRKFPWDTSHPEQLDDALLEQVATTLLQFVRALDPS